MTPVISASRLTKRYGKDTFALREASFTVESGRIVGLIGPNGAGKTTALKAILGLLPVEGELRVLGMDPAAERERLMEQVSFIADVAVLPRWIRVSEAIDYVEGVHPRFSRAKCQAFLARTEIKPIRRVRELSKGMVAQLHLALVMAIDARLLVLDEPTLGLDILYRKQFYESLLGDYFDADKTILVTTHQVEEIEHILSDVLFIRDGRIVLDATMDAIGERFVEVMVGREQREAAIALGPVNERTAFGKHVFLFDAADPSRLAGLGEQRRPGLADIFVATMSRPAAPAGASA